MFTVYGVYREGHSDAHVECATLDEAFTHLRELILNEIEDADGPVFDAYGIRTD